MQDVARDRAGLLDSRRTRRDARAVNLPCARLALVAALLATPPSSGQASLAYSSLTTLFFERFEDANFSARGWYDGSVVVSSAEHVPGSTSSAEFRFLPGATTPTSGGAMRHKFAASDIVYLSYWVKYSANWQGSNKPYHPHEFHFLTNLDSDWVGPAFTHLTTYIEQNEGVPLLAIQDGVNIDQAQIGVDLTQVTENRGVAGCNGDSDGHGAGDCYLSGSLYRNGKDWRAPMIYFQDAPGSYYKNDWHFIEAVFKLNRIAQGKGVADGQVKYWFDGVAILDFEDAMLRTGANPTMQFVQFLVAPYIGDGSPVDQTMWVDDLTVAVPGVSLLRNDAVTTLAPLSPPTATIFTGTGRWTLDESGPDGIAQEGEGALESQNGSADDDDFYRANFPNAASDPDLVKVVADTKRPLVYYQVTVSGNTLGLVKDATGSVAISY